MVNLFPHDKATGKDLVRLNTLILRQANTANKQQETVKKLQEQVTTLSKKVTP
jgi:hypothetical protein